MNGHVDAAPDSADVKMVPMVDPSTRPCAGAIPQDDYDLDTPWHCHDMHQLQYAFSGMIEVEDRFGSYFIPRALAAWIPAGVAHRTRIHRVRSASIFFEPHMIPVPGDRIRIIQVSTLMREMVLGAMRWPLHGPLDKTGHAYFQALAALCAEWIEEEAPLRLPSLPDPKLEAAALYTRKNLNSCDIASVSRHCGLSERTLRRRFQSAIGMSWEQYRQRARLLKAAALLNEGKLPIGVIAAEVGFESQSSFTRAFKSLTGLNPKDFRAV